MQTYTDTVSLAVDVAGAAVLEAVLDGCAGDKGHGRSSDDGSETHFDWLLGVSKTNLVNERELASEWKYKKILQRRKRTNQARAPATGSGHRLFMTAASQARESLGH